jgi:hypothetical protein
MPKPKKDRSLAKLGTILGVGFILLLAGNVYSLSGLWAQPKQSETIRERWQATNGQFQIRVTEFAEDNGWPLPGVYYVYESSASGSDAWNAFLTFREDDPNPISHEQIHFVNDRVAYILLSNDYAATADGGTTWSINKYPDFPAGKVDVSDVVMAPDGSGSLITAANAGTKPQLMRTFDCGRHWIYASE